MADLLRTPNTDLAEKQSAGGAQNAQGDSLFNLENQGLGKDVRFQRNKQRRFRTYSCDQPGHGFYQGSNGFPDDMELDFEDNDTSADKSGPTAVKGAAPVVHANKVPFGKNSKKSRNTQGRCFMKKGGAGGKGVWGKPGSELGVEFDPEDENDPNYDSEAQEIDRFQNEELPKLTQQQFNLMMNTWLQEYFENSDCSEIERNISSINVSTQERSRLSYLAICLALQRKPMQCELTSQLLAHLSSKKVITDTEIHISFNMLLKELADLSIDAPEAPEIVGRFIARAVADDILCPKFVQSFKGQVECPFIIKALARAENLLTVNHAFTRLDNVWGVSGGDKPTKLLQKKMRLLLEEYLSSDDAEEAAKCLRELDVPHFHHEVVYQAVLLLIEKSTDDSCSRLVRLLASWLGALFITPQQMKIGIKRIYDDMRDISLDVPAAYFILERFVEQARNADIISRKQVLEMPQKGRKRFVSEGDRWRIAEEM